MALLFDSDGLVDVRALMDRYTVEELNEAADDYYKDFESKRITLKPFNLPDAQHLLAGFAHMICGLDLTSDDKVLDFGCGMGWASRMLNACGCEVIGMDVSGRATVIASNISREWGKFFTAMGEDRPGLSFKRFDGYRIDLPDASVSKIFVSDAFHHIPNPEAVIKEFYRVLTPDGIAGFSEPGPNHSKTPDAQLEMKMHKVVENDIDVEVIWEQAQEAGFAKMDLFVSPLIGRQLSLDDYLNFPTDTHVTSDFIGASNWRSKNFPIFFLHKAGSGVGNSKRSEGLRCAIRFPSNRSFEARAGEPFKWSFDVTNTGSSRWLPSGSSRGSVNVGILITGPEETVEYRNPFTPNSFEPGEKRTHLLELPALPSGFYKVEIDMVAEFVTWFKGLGNETVVFDLVVR